VLMFPNIWYLINILSLILERSPFIWIPHFR
jgi:hypothetical protein